MGLITGLAGSISAALQNDYRLVVLIGIILSGLISSGVYYHQLKPKGIKPLPAKLANNKARAPGSWTPEDYVLPVPTPYKNWDVYTTPPLPYRAFKQKYNVTMGIRNMDTNEWIELDNEWLKYHRLKQKRIKEMGTEVYGTLPEARAGAMECIAELRKYLPARYPSLFQQTPEGIKILATGEEFNTVNPEIDPMLIAAQLLQDDIAIMVEQPDSQYWLKGGAIMLAGFWRLKDKVNTPLSYIHTSGEVPKYDTHLKKGMEKFFYRLTPEAPVVRNNYFLQTDPHLDWSVSIGPEDSPNVGWNTANAATDISQIYYRSERQSVRRLPISGAVVFTIRTYFHPLTQLAEERGIPERLYKGIESWSDDVKEYRGYNKFCDVVLPYLKEKWEEQESKGWTMQNSYPW
jgi:hypothetical protein